jgi:hypothetical protein
VVTGINDGMLGDGDEELTMATNWGSPRLDFLHEENRGVEAELKLASEREGTAGGRGALARKRGGARWFHIEERK